MPLGLAIGPFTEASANVASGSWSAKRILVQQMSSGNKQSSRCPDNKNYVQKLVRKQVLADDCDFLFFEKSKSSGIERAFFSEPSRL